MSHETWKWPTKLRMSGEGGGDSEGFAWYIKNGIGVRSRPRFRLHGNTPFGSGHGLILHSLWNSVPSPTLPASQRC